MNITCTAQFTGCSYFHRTPLIIQSRRFVTRKYGASAVARLLKNNDSNPHSHLELPKSPHSHNNLVAQVGVVLPKLPSPPPAEQALLSIAFISLGLFSSLIIIALPTLNSFQRLSVSMQKLSKTISEEVPGTFISLKFSGLEINDLALRLRNLRERLHRRFFRRKDRDNKPSGSQGKDSPVF
ncbi:uncharacterized protein LOC131034301 isoform X2 [Cryptomeria japonica]|uniref:uncharacterized protein LOC131034301 isoform X2 n=1 Tax=Cryptomeria japonica TaxID=3369 RepID=UPI0025AD4F10|nr:uncharacterized protein LOC131034301 isoform X2 [Cryptomeria japonica]